MDADLLDALSQLDTSSLADADKTLRVMDGGLRPVRSGLKLLGVARTVRCFEDFLTIIKALDESTAGEVLVVETSNSQRAVVGELFSLEAERRGLGGIIVDGPVRDTATLKTLSMPVYARSFCPTSGTVKLLQETQIEISCGGVVVAPGDIVIGDDDGVLVASARQLSGIIESAAAIQTAEARLRARMAAGDSLLDMLNYREHASAVANGQVSQLAFRLGDE